MDRENTAYSRARQRRRARRARWMRRVRACLLAAALMAGLAVYAGSRAAQGAVSVPASIPDAREAELDALVSGVLDEIITDGMTRLEQTRAVFDYAHDQIRYTGHSGKSDWQTGAYEGLTTREGDCFTYYAVSRALLTALEIDNLPVERVGGETRHYWNLVDCGDGWYHFDACPRSSRLPDFVSFLFTDRQAADFTALAGRNYYDFDGSLLPRRAEEIVTET